MRTLYTKTSEIKKEWYIIDATDRPLGDVASRVVTLVRGKHKASYTPHQDNGDFVIVINIDKIRVTGNKPLGKMYYQHSGFPGGMRSFNYTQLASRHADAPLRRAIKGMLPRGPLGYKMLRAVKLYAGAKHPHVAQQPAAYTW
ncbi:MAG: 50S ribosomal protein L13 [Spirochaetia bacterium]